MKPSTNKPRLIGLYGNPDKPDLPIALAEVRECCIRNGIDYVLSPLLAQLDPQGVVADSDQELVRQADVLVVFGGDGTMLRAARLTGETGTPMLGINLGSLGYLTDVLLSELTESLEQMFAGEFYLGVRSRVSCKVRRDGEIVINAMALNDIVINMGPLPRALNLELKMDSALLGRFLGDGLIVSTPTGSTAYNLSAGGPIIHPGISGLIVTPICPHSLAMRPIVVPDDKKIRLKLLDVGQGATLTVDGQEAFPLRTGDAISFMTAAKPVNLIKFPRSDFFRVMRRKLQWGAIKRRRARD